MIDKFAKLEEFINKLLEKLIALCWSLIHKVVPKKVFEKINFWKFKLKTRIEILFNKVKKFTHKTFEVCKKYFKLTKEKVLFAKNFDYKAKVFEILNQIKTYFKETALKDIFLTVKNFFSSKWIKLKSKFSHVTKAQWHATTIGLCLTVLGGLGVYSSFNNIYESEFPYRAPANVQEYDYRPEYKMYEKKSTKMFNIKIPVEPEKIGAITSITVDFNIRTSTREARLHITKYEYKLKDHFFTNVEMIQSDFPLEEEGKDVLKDKMIEALNDFLRLEGLEDAYIEDINILFIVAT